jgi:hypothetical protein
MPDLLSEGQTPEAWSAELQGFGVYVSPRLIRSKAHKTGQFYKIGRLMLLTRKQIVSLIECPADADRSKNDLVLPGKVQ